MEFLILYITYGYFLGWMADELWNHPDVNRWYWQFRGWLYEWTHNGVRYDLDRIKEIIG